MIVTGAGEPERVDGVKISANFFDLLGVKPLLGPVVPAGGGSSRCWPCGADWRRTMESQVRLVARCSGQEHHGGREELHDRRRGAGKIADLHHCGCVHAARPIQRGAFPRSARQPGHGGNRQNEARSDAGAGSRGYGFGGAKSCRGISGREQRHQHLCESAEGRHHRRHRPDAFHVAGRRGIRAADCVRERCELAAGSFGGAGA